MPNSAVTFADGLEAAYTGDAVRLYQAKVVRQGLKTCQIGMRLNSAYTPTNCKLMAAKFTGKKYGRGKPALAQAILDLTEWINACEAAIPVVDERTS